VVFDFGSLLSRREFSAHLTKHSVGLHNLGNNAMLKCCAEASDSEESSTKTGIFNQGFNVLYIDSPLPPKNNQKTAGIKISSHRFQLAVQMDLNSGVKSTPQAIF
jgi:hypothetical protein